jgi:hypothetical protein
VTSPGLPDLGVGDGYDLVLDSAASIPPPGPETRITSPACPVPRRGEPLLLYGFKRPPKAAPVHAGVTADEVRRRFCDIGWNLIDAGPTSVETPVARRADDRFELWRYHLRRT